MKSFRDAALEMATTGWIVARADAGESPFDPEDITFYDTPTFERLQAASDRREVFGMLAIVIIVAAMWATLLLLAGMVS